MYPEASEKSTDERPRIVLRRITDVTPEILPEDAIPPRRLRWWQVAGALLLVGVLLLEMLLPVIEALIRLFQFIPAGGGLAV